MDGEDEAGPGDAARALDFDLTRLAANLRGVMPRVDEDARERLEHAWVAILNAIKQPKVDAARLAARLSRLADELDALRPRSGRDATPSDDQESVREQLRPVEQIAPNPQDPA